MEREISHYEDRRVVAAVNIVGVAYAPDPIKALSLCRRKNAVELRREPNRHDITGYATAVYCRGYRIGFVPSDNDLIHEAVSAGRVSVSVITSCGEYPEMTVIYTYRKPIYAPYITQKMRRSWVRAVREAVA